MGKQRIDNHLQQIILNIKYEYEEGRLSAIDLLSSVIQKFPLPVIEGHSQLFFFPLVLQFVNDDSKKCKEAVAKCISLLLKRVTMDIMHGLFDYAKRWSQSCGVDSLPMQHAAAQLFGIFVESRPDYVKRGSNASDIISQVLGVMRRYIPFVNDSGWELLFSNLVCIEKINKELAPLISTNYDIWGALVEFLAYPHPSVMQVSSRIISSQVSILDPKKLTGECSDSFIAKIPGSLYNIARNLCCQLDVDDGHYDDSTSILAIKTITWVFQAMKEHPNLCYENGVAESEHEDSEEDDQQARLKDPCLWLMTRLSNAAKPKGIRRRESIFKCFAALCTSCNPDQLNPYLQLMICPIDRAIREESNKLRPDDQQENDPVLAFPKDVLQLLEDTCGTDKFLQAYAEVNRKARQKREKRKQELAVEAVHNPKHAAKRKIKKQLQEKERRKRRVKDRRVWVASKRNGANKYS